MDFNYSKGPNTGKVERGIYVLDGDTLKLCVDEADIKEHPKELASKEGTQQVLLIFKREKK